MENASKALIIAGAILLSILIIALGIYVFNMAKGATNTDQLDAVQKQSFNQQFSSYKGTVNGSTVIELVNFMEASATKNKEVDEMLPDLIGSTSSGSWRVVQSKVGSPTGYNNGYGHVKFSEFRGDVIDSHMYYVDYDINADTGLIDAVYVLYNKSSLNDARTNNQSWKTFGY